MKNDLGSLAARVARALCLLAALSALTTARAGTTSTLTNGGMIATPMAGGWTLSPGPAGGTAPVDRTFERLLGGKVPVFDPFELPGKAGKLPVRVARGVAVVDAAAAVARCLSRSVICAASIAAGYLLYEKYRVRKKPGEDGLEHDEGTAPTEQTAYCEWAGGNNFVYCAESPMAAYLLKVRDFHKNFVDSWGENAASSTIMGTATCTGNRCTGLYSRITTPRVCYPNGNCVGGDFQYSGQYTIQTDENGTVKLCQPINGVTRSVDADGRCGTGVYRPTTPAEAASKVVQYPPQEGDQQMPEALRDAIQQGESVPSTITTSGPQTQTGEPSKLTTTTSGGTTTTTDTPTYTYKYEGDTISYTTTVNTTVINNDGSTTTTTTTTEGPKPEDQKDPCTNNPNRVGCMELGTPPTDAVPKTARDVSFTPEPLGLPAQCPAPVQLPHGQVISYQTVCDGLVQTRPLIIAMGFLMAGGIILRSLRG